MFESYAADIAHQHNVQYGECVICRLVIEDEPINDDTEGEL